MQSKIPIGRLGQPDEIAAIVALLATNAYMTNKVRLFSRIVITFPANYRIAIDHRGRRRMDLRYLISPYGLEMRLARS